MSKKTETRNFKMHPKLLFDVIRRQAGTLAKAILEGVMNSVDAGATECRITLRPKRCDIVDDGKGFQSKKEVEQWFEVFGQPHDESEKKKYGTFRMGRGQMFAFGKNIWKTGQYLMDVDIYYRGLDYDLTTGNKNEPGCRIEITLYNRLLPSDLDQTERSLEQWVKWIPIPVFFNDRRISKDPAKAKWDKETDDAYIKLKQNGGLAIYNLGAHVLELPNSDYGTGGEVVSKKQIKVNFARNDIQSDCPVWNRVKKLVDRRAMERVIKKKAITDGERQRLADKLLRGEMAFDYKARRDMKLITACTGRQHSCDQLMSLVNFPQLSVAPKGSLWGDRVHRQQLAFVIADETLDRFHVDTVPELLAALDKLLLQDDKHYHGSFGKLKFTPLDQLVKNMDNKHTILLDEELKPNEILWLRLMECGIALLTSEDEQAKWRKLKIGESKCANGWTDGSAYIAVARGFLAKCQPSLDGFYRVGRLLLHEMCHHSPDTEDHDHDQAFYEEFHDNVESIGWFASHCLVRLPKIVTAVGKKLTKTQLCDADAVVKADKSMTALLKDHPTVAIRGGT